MYLADTLSIAYQSLSPTDTRRSETESPEVESIHAVDYVAISEQQLSEIKQETAKDPNLQTLKNLILRGWPKTAAQYQRKSQSTLMSETNLPYKTESSLKAKDVLSFRP